MNRTLSPDKSLGPVESDYGTMPGRKHAALAWGVLLLILIPLAIWGGVFLSNDSSGFASAVWGPLIGTAIACVLLGGLAGALLLAAARLARCRLIVCRDGLIWGSPNAACAVTWQELQSIIYSTARSDKLLDLRQYGLEFVALGRKFGVTSSIWLLVPHMVLPRHQLDFIRMQIESKFVAARLEQTLAELSQRQTITFGKLQADSDGVTWRRRKIAWHEIKNIGEPVPPPNGGRFFYPLELTSGETELLTDSKVHNIALLRAVWHHHVSQSIHNVEQPAL